MPSRLPGPKGRNVNHEPRSVPATAADEKPIPNLPAGWPGRSLRKIMLRLLVRCVKPRGDVRWRGRAGGGTATPFVARLSCERTLPRNTLSITGHPSSRCNRNRSHRTGQLLPAATAVRGGPVPGVNGRGRAPERPVSSAPQTVAANCLQVRGDTSPRFQPVECLRTRGPRRARLLDRGHQRYFENGGAVSRSHKTSH